MFAELPGSAKVFYNSIMVESLNALKLNTFFDNFDAARFNFDGVDRCKLFNSSDHAFYFEWFLRNMENLFAAYSLLGNEESKRDLFEIVGFVKEHFPFYSMYIDHYTIHGEETVLYCRP